MSQAKQINAKELAKELKAGSLDNRYLFLGEEEGLKEKITEEIYGLLKKKHGEEGVVMGRFHAESGDLVSAVDFIVSQSMFTEAKLAVIYEIDTVPSAKQSRYILEELFEGQPPSCTLIMTSSQNKTPRALTADMMKTVRVVRFWKLFESDAAAYIRTGMKRGKIDITDGAVRLLLELLGRDVRKIDGALEKLIFSGNAVVTEETVAAHIIDEKDTTIFEFLEHLFRGSQRALNLLKTMLDDGVHELVILTMITRQCEAIGKYHHLARQGTGGDEILSSLGIQERNRDGFLAQTRFLNAGDAAKAWAAILLAESRIKDRNLSRSILANPLFELVENIVLKRRNSA